MTIQTNGIHHITAIVQNPQVNLDFYEGFLGLRLVKKTVNFDDPGVYHFYFGDEYGRPGTILTFFPIERAMHGRVGMGQVERTLFSIPKGSAAYWEERLSEHEVSYNWKGSTLAFNDPEGLELGLIEEDREVKDVWENSSVPKEKAIQGFYGATLHSKAPKETVHLLTSMGYDVVEETEEHYELKASADLAQYLYIPKHPSVRGLQGAGTVHHIAFRTEKEADQQQWQQQLGEQGLRVTPVKDRDYFKSVYFHEPGGILFEIATDEPGFLIDEELHELGDHLRLPKWLDSHRNEIEAALPTIVRGKHS
ncbi:ring-cleaving dioxygenase mhqO [Pontibacillus halophilus JSM 076056 = DSM 19796]|uniref:Ring-cleaving dioxygenase mhqO n=1 Tax=Pontibacillus halophilus JSM 076056 = DSM 19796 TaxID=1385510 RepID=A0A0A5GL66_9BACI|nr:VOC family protein [Pontibacillus halophilus]KGX91958.1 ring-cleaving dioxygenase mhqO [Pontibacillus halophilus JSM 076056 = DSM 19796]